MNTSESERGDSVATRFGKSLPFHRNPCLPLVVHTEERKVGRQAAPCRVACEIGSPSSPTTAKGQHTSRRAQGSRRDVATSRPGASSVRRLCEVEKEVRICVLPRALRRGAEWNRKRHLREKKTATTCRVCTYAKRLRQYLYSSPTELPSKPDPLCGHTVRRRGWVGEDSRNVAQP